MTGENLRNAYNTENKLIVNAIHTQKESKEEDLLWDYKNGHIVNQNFGIDFFRTGIKHLMVRCTDYIGPYGNKMLGKFAKSCKWLETLELDASHSLVTQDLDDIDLHDIVNNITSTCNNLTEFRFRTEFSNIDYIARMANIFLEKCKKIEVVKIENLVSNRTFKFQRRIINV